jgi:hypothetical protein
MTCCVCTRPDDNMLLAKLHRDRRPVCPACFDRHKTSDGRIGLGLRDHGLRFDIAEMPSPVPLEILELWGEP